MKTLSDSVKLVGILLIFLVSLFSLAASPAAAATYTVKMGTDSGLLAYEPSQLTIQPGDTVVWVNNKVYPHNVVFDPKELPRQNAALAKQLSAQKLLVSPNQKVAVTFPEEVPAGEYTYYCQPHRGAGMIGKIIVE